MKKRIFSLVTVVMLVAMTLPAISPPPVAAGGASVDFTQYANEDDEWINSILNKNNSKYYECMSVPQRTICLLYTSPSPRDRQRSRMPSSA